MKRQKINAKLRTSSQSQSLGKTTVMTSGGQGGECVHACVSVCMFCALSAQPKCINLYLFKFKIKIVYDKSKFLKITV